MSDQIFKSDFESKLKETIKNMSNAEEQQGLANLDNAGCVCKHGGGVLIIASDINQQKLINIDTSGEIHTIIENTHMKNLHLYDGCVYCLQDGRVHKIDIEGKRFELVQGTPKYIFKFIIYNERFYYIAADNKSEQKDFHMFAHCCDMFLYSSDFKFRDIIILDERACGTFTIGDGKLFYIPMYSEICMIDLKSGDKATLFKKDSIVFIDRKVIIYLNGYIYFSMLESGDNAMWFCKLDCNGVCEKIMFGVKSFNITESEIFFQPTGIDGKGYGNRYEKRYRKRLVRTDLEGNIKQTYKGTQFSNNINIVNGLLYFKNQTYGYKSPGGVNDVISYIESV